MKIIRNNDEDCDIWPWMMDCRGGRFLHIPSFTALILQSLRFGFESRRYENMALERLIFDENN